MLLISLCPIKYLLCYRRSLTADQCASAVHVPCRGDFECHKPANTGLSGCPTETQKALSQATETAGNTAQANVILHCKYINMWYILDNSFHSWRKCLLLYEQNIKVLCSFSVFIFTCKPIIQLVVLSLWHGKQFLNSCKIFYLIHMVNTILTLAISSVSTVTKMSFCSYLNVPAFLFTLGSHFWGLWMEFILPYSRCEKLREILGASYPLVAWG